MLAKAIYRYPRERYQLYDGGVVGGGSGFRFRIDPQQSAALPASDTVRGGPVVFGPVGGIVLPLAERLSVVGELRVLVGAPDLAAMADFNVGLQFDSVDRPLDRSGSLASLSPERHLVDAG